MTIESVGWRGAWALALSALLMGAVAGWHFNHLREARAQRVNAAPPVEAVVVDSRDAYFGRTLRYPEIEVKFTIGGDARVVWLRAARPDRRWKPGETVVVYVARDGGLATADGYLSERLQVVAPDVEVALAGILLMLAGMAAAGAVASARRGRRLDRLDLAIVAVAGMVHMTTDGEITDALWTRPLDKLAAARADVILGRRIDTSGRPFIEPLAGFAAVDILRDTSIDQKGSTNYLLVGRAEAEHSSRAGHQTNVPQSHGPHYTAMHTDDVDNVNP